MRAIELTKGQVAIVDDEDFNELAQYRWYVDHKGYACRNVLKSGKTTGYRMHRVIMGAKKGEQIDHINQNKLDNRRCNLRFASYAENARNRGKSKRNKSGFKGAS